MVRATIMVAFELFHAMPLHAMPLHAMPLHAMPLHRKSLHRMLLHRMSLHRMLHAGNRREHGVIAIGRRYPR